MKQSSETSKKVFPIKEHSEIIEKTLDSYGIRVRVAEVNYLPDDAIQYCLEIVTGTKLEDIEKRKRELALALASSSGTVEIQAPIPGRALVGITVPKVVKVDAFRPNPNEPKTILGMVINKIAEILGMILVILLYSVEKIEENKNIGRQILVVILVPIALTLLLFGSFDFSKIFEFMTVSFITWVFVLGLQTKNMGKDADKEEESTKDKETKGELIANQHQKKGE